MENGKTFCFVVESSDTVLSLKQKIRERATVSPEEQRLVYAGKQLKDERTLGDYNIQNHSTIYLVIRLGGGMDVFGMNLTCKHFVLNV